MKSGSQLMCFLPTIQGKDGSVHYVCCFCYSGVHKKNLFLAPKLDNLEKHNGSTKVFKNLLNLRVKNNEWYINKHRLHLRNEKTFQGN